MAFQIYRNTPAGLALVGVLADLVRDGKLPEAMAESIMEQFDEASP
jgi:hypothetical protein